MYAQTARELIKKHEGDHIKRGRHLPYSDTVNKITIGYGRNLTDRGVSQLEADLLFDNDYRDTLDELVTRLPWVRDLDPVRRAVVVDLAFNMGVPTLLTFRRTLGALEAGDVDRAADELLYRDPRVTPRVASKYATQTKTRAKRNARMLRTGSWPSR